jgi:hypothetical protein
VNSAHGRSLTSTLTKISANHSVPLSTLKLNAKILRELELISVRDSSVLLTESGLEALALLEESGVQTMDPSCECGVTTEGIS